MTGRQATHMLRQHLRLSETTSMVYTTSDMYALSSLGGSRGQVSQLKDAGGEILGNMSTTLGPLTFKGACSSIR